MKTASTLFFVAIMASPVPRIPGHGVSISASTSAATFTYAWQDGQLAADSATIDFNVTYSDAGGQLYTSQYHMPGCLPTGDGDGEIPQNFATGDTLYCATEWFDSSGNSLGTASATVVL
ncbi:MAG: hypothetical protein H6832_09940 [Planctomycetes bacterium]|nr:hypothetical protein [Planctomycetota bacterium]MCB9891855.1 hypothetical protein [Planctomycetota bacterium]MCB9918711.1 hypothetical protein [Planctomycetota bacterium]